MRKKAIIDCGNQSLRCRLARGRGVLDAPHATRQLVLEGCGVWRGLPEDFFDTDRPRKPRLPGQFAQRSTILPTLSKLLGAVTDLMTNRVALRAKGEIVPKSPRATSLRVQLVETSERFDQSIAVLRHQM